MTRAIRAYRHGAQVREELPSIFRAEMLRPPADMAQMILTPEWMCRVAPLAGPTGAMILLSLAMRDINRTTRRPCRARRMQQELADDIGVSRDTVRSAVRHLVKLGLLKIIRVGHSGDPTLYEIPAGFVALQETA